MKKDSCFLWLKVVLRLNIVVVVERASRDSSNTLEDIIPKSQIINV